MEHWVVIGTNAFMGTEAAPLGDANRREMVASSLVHMVTQNEVKSPSAYADGNSERTLLMAS